MEFEIFSSGPEADAFIRGMETAIDCLDSDHLSVDPEPEYNSDTQEWRVNYRKSC
jgi:hypothetical protein